MLISFCKAKTEQLNPGVVAGSVDIELDFKQEASLREFLIKTDVHHLLLTTFKL